MNHQVVYSSQASREIEEAADWWAINRDLQQAQRWYVAFSEKLAGLTNDPNRFPLASENDLFPYELREILFGLSARPTHRAVFTITPTGTVIILSIRHTSQDKVTPETIEFDPPH